MPKPLPAIPGLYTDNPPPPLAFQARVHLKNIINQVVKEEALESSWVDSIIVALDEFGTAFTHEGWIQGLRYAARVKPTRPLSETIGGVTLKPPTANGEGSTSRFDSPKHDVDSGSRLRSPGRQKRLFQRNEAEYMNRTLAQMHRIRALGRPSDQISKAPCHLLLTLERHHHFFGSPHLDGAPCHFSPSELTFPYYEIDGAKEGQGAVELLGIQSWKSWHSGSDAAPTDEDMTYLGVRIVGGTFRMAHVSSKQHASLVKVLRVAIYAYISLLLEDSFLKDNHVELQYYSPQLPAIPLPPSPLPSPQILPYPHTTTEERAKRPGKGPAGIWSFLTKKTFELKHFRNRSWGFDPPVPPPVPDMLPSPERHPISLPEATPTVIDVESRFTVGSGKTSTKPFTTALETLRVPDAVLSTSPSIHFPPPELLVRLAAQEESEAGDIPSNNKRRDRSPHSLTFDLSPRKKRMRINGADRAGLTSILGWRSDGSGMGMGGVAGFVRHQSITVLFSSSRPSNAPLESDRPPDLPGDISCQPPILWTYEYAGDTGFSLGSVVVQLCGQTPREKCQREGCDAEMHQHTYRWTHDGMTLSGTLAATDEEKSSDAITMHLSCRLCDKQTAPTSLADGSYLMNFGKFMELILYSDEPTAISPPLCEHVKAAGRAKNSPHPRLVLRRHFVHRSFCLTFSVSLVENLYEARMPHFQITKSHAEVSRGEEISQDGLAIQEKDVGLDKEREGLKLDMTSWWKKLKDHLDQLTGYVTAQAEQEYVNKSLPMTPPHERSSSTPPLSTSAEPTPMPRKDWSTYFPGARNLFTPDPSTTTSSSSFASLPLQQMRNSFSSVEQSLYAQLYQTPIDCLNDVRRAFMSAAADVSQQLREWQAEYLPPSIADEIGRLDFDLPDWWSKETHCLPASRVVVRESEWGSIIAFALQSSEYRTELGNLAIHRHSAWTMTPDEQPSQTSYFGPIPNTTSPGLVAGSSTPTPESSDRSAQSHATATVTKKDNEFYPLEPESFSATISRKGNPRDASSLHAFRDVLLRQQRSFEKTPSPSRLRNSSPSSSRFMGMGMNAPAAAWSKPAVELSQISVDGHMTTEEPDSIEQRRFLREKFSEADFSDDVPAPVPRTPPQKRRAPRHVPSWTDTVESTSFPLTPERPLPDRVSALLDPELVPDAHPFDTQSSSAGPSITSTLTSAMRYVFAPCDTLAVPVTPGTESDSLHRLALLGVDHGPSGPHIDERPHLKYDFTIANKLKFSCTAYYALQFANLRKQSSADGVFLRSLERTTDWLADGGKSKSNFFKTTDDRFIIKTLVNAWNVADLQVLLELSPAYFRYMNATQDKPSAIAKLFGFYTIEIKHLQSGTTEAKIDLLVMENLFYSEEVDVAYDLKGIPSRKIKNIDSSTLFDLEWIQNQSQSPIYIQPRSKHVLWEAIKADSEFLANNNIMDYSLLLGVNKGRKAIACGIVDTFGSYTFAKTLEYKAKHSLRSGKGKGKEVTVLPPVEYQARFLNSLDSYFVSVPDKWSKPVSSRGEVSDIFTLISVL